MRSLQGQLSHLQGELHEGSAREEQLRGQVEHLSQVGKVEVWGVGGLGCRMVEVWEGRKV